MMYLVFVNELAGLRAGAPRVSQSIVVSVSVMQSPVCCVSPLPPLSLFHKANHKFVVASLLTVHTKSQLIQMPSAISYIPLISHNPQPSAR